MKRGIASLFVLLTLLPIIEACSSSYQPARSPRIQTVIEGGTPTFVKDGTMYGGPLFGSGVVEAVHGNPRAEAEARVGRNLAIGGFVFDIAGLGTEIAGLAAIKPNTPGNNNTLPLGLLIGGLVGVGVGTGLLLAAPAHTYDAINIYNDALDAPR